MKKQVRVYRQEARAEKTEATADEIVKAMVKEIRSVRRLSEITLEEVAAKSGVTVRTILRRFGSRDGLLEAAFESLRVEIEGQRPETRPGDMHAGLRALLAQYEAMGDLNIRALEQEDQIPLLHELLNHGRAMHRQWIEHVFGPEIEDSGPQDRERKITALYAATDVYLWKLLRRDLKLGKKETAIIFERMAVALVNEGA
jgi:AcrR family transcriptional regulator